jgi:hypothetical protein
MGMAARGQGQEPAPAQNGQRAAAKRDRHSPESAAWSQSFEID